MGGDLRTTPVKHGLHHNSEKKPIQLLFLCMIRSFCSHVSKAWDEKNLEEGKFWEVTSFEVKIDLVLSVPISKSGD